MSVAQNAGDMDERQQVNIPPRNQFAEEIDHMADCVMTGTAPRTPGEEGLADHLVMEANYESARTGRPVRPRSASPTWSGTREHPPVRTGSPCMPPDLPPPPIPDPATASIFLDFDGTLVDLAPTPDGIVIDAALPALLARLAAAMPGRVAIVSGRSIAQLDGFLGGHLAPVAVAGSHGAERRTRAGGHILPERSPALEAAANSLHAYADLHGLLFEAKSLGVTLHFRHDPEREEEAVAVATRIAAQHDLYANRGKMMVEVRLPGDKGAALRDLMADAAMAGTTPWFLGDDLTDEDGFAAAAAFGGAGVLVDPPRATRARYRLDGVAAVRAWLTALAGHPGHAGIDVPA